MQTQAMDAAGEGGGKALLLFLVGHAAISGSAVSEHVCISCGKEKRDFRVGTLAMLADAGLVMRSSQQIVLSAAGQELASQLRQRPGLRLAEATGRKGQAATAVLANPDESPLVALQSGARTGGKAFLSPAEYDAGERLRSDFTCAMLTPRISANWTAAVSGGKRGGDANSSELLTNSTLAARQRFEAALACLGPDLSGVAADICCFLKGFEQVEMERKWPKRSAKFMLKAGLAVLALHYWPRNERAKSIRRWGAPDYRPEINSKG